MVATPALPRQTDLLVIGGGPAGLAAAIAARQVGLTVVLADRAAPPIDKACGEGLMPDGVAALALLGIRLRAEDGQEFRGIRFIDKSLSAQAAFASGTGMGIRRPVLHKLLIARALEAGVALHWQSPVQAIVPTVAGHVVAVGNHQLHCRFVAGADGAQSAIRRFAGIGLTWRGERRVGLRQHFRIKPWTDFVEVYWQSGRQAYVTPVASDQVCVALIGPPPGLRFADLPDAFPDLARRLGAALPSSAPRGAISQSTRMTRVTGPALALLGDASGSVDAITGEGMALCFRQALALAPALAAGYLGQYQLQHRRTARLPCAMARLMLWMGRHDRMRRASLRLMSAQPVLFHRMLAMHVGGPGLALDPPRAQAHPSAGSELAASRQAG